MSGPRILFNVVRSTEPEKARSWLNHASQVAGPLAVQGSAADGGVVWQLNSANHRTIARSVLIHASFESALETVHGVRQKLDRVIIRSVKLASQSVYGWYGTLDSTVVFTCARWYTTVRDTRDSLGDARAALATAHIGDAPRRLAGNRINR